MTDKLSRVLVPVSGQPEDEEAVALACELARQDKGTVLVRYVTQVPRSLPLDAEISAETARSETVLQAMERIGKRHKCRMDGEMLQARDVGPAVVQEAVTRDVQLVVIGVPYQERFGMPSTGDTVPYILKHSPCRVIVNRIKSGTDQGTQGRS